MNYKWNYKPLAPEDLACAEELAEEMRLSLVVAQILVSRGIRTADEARGFFRPQLQELHDPFLMNDMDPIIPCRIGIANGATVIGTSIIHQNQFKI